MEYSMENNKEFHLMKIRYMKKFFLKSFVVSLVIMILFMMMGAMMFNFCAGMADYMYGVDIEDYGMILLLVMGLWKILIIQFTLVPFIVSHMIEKHISQHYKQTDQ